MSEEPNLIERPAFLGPNRLDAASMDHDSQWPVRMLQDLHRGGLTTGERVDALVRALAHELGAGPRTEIPAAIGHVIARLVLAATASHAVRVAHLLANPVGRA